MPIEFVRFAAPTARAEPACPSADASAPYDVVSPNGICTSAVHTCFWNDERRERERELAELAGEICGKLVARIGEPRINLDPLAGMHRRHAALTSPSSYARDNTSIVLPSTV